MEGFSAERIRWRRRAISLAAVVILVLLLEGELVRHVWDFPAAADELPVAIAAYRAKGLPWTATDLRPDAKISPDENAAPLLERAVRALHRPMWTSDSLDARRAADAGDWPKVVRYLHEVRPGMVLVEQAADRPRSDFGFKPDDEWNAPPSGGAELVEAAEAMGLQARLDAREHRGEAAVREIGRVRAVGRFLGVRIGSTGYFRQIRIEQYALRSALRMAEWDPKLAPSLLRQFKTRATSPDLVRMLREEAYLCVAGFRNGAGEDLESLEGGDSRPSPLVRRDGIPPDQKGRAYLCRTLQFWTRAEDQIQRFQKQPAKLGPALDRLLDEALDHPGRSYRFPALALRSFGALETSLFELQADQAITFASLRALDVRERTGRWPEALIQGQDSYGHSYLGRREGDGFRILSRGADGTEDPASTPKTRQSRRDDIVSVYRPPVRNRKPRSK